MVADENLALSVGPKDNDGLTVQKSNNEEATSSLIRSSMTDIAKSWNQSGDY